MTALAKVVAYTDTPGLPVVIAHLDCSHSAGVAREKAPPVGTEVECRGCEQCACGMPSRPGMHSAAACGLSSEPAKACACEFCTQVGEYGCPNAPDVGEEMCSDCRAASSAALADDAEEERHA